MGEVEVKMIGNVIRAGFEVCCGEKSFGNVILLVSGDEVDPMRDGVVVIPVVDIIVDGASDRFVVNIVDSLVSDVSIVSIVD